MFKLPNRSPTKDGVLVTKKTYSWIDFLTKYQQLGGFLYEDSLTDSGYTNAHWYTELKDSIRIVKEKETLTTKSNILNALSRIEEELTKGKFLFICAHYELGFLLEPFFEPIAQTIPEGTILIEIFIFSSRETITYVNPNLSELDSSHVISVKPTISKSKYNESIQLAKSFLESGESYELNVTFDAKVEAQGNPFLLYQKLKRKQRTICSAFLHSEEQFTLSFSPEIFWLIQDRDIKTFPMKGTAKRKPSLFQDKQASFQLSHSEKERAENVMITDLFRNDLGKISQIGSVEVISLFRTEPLESIWQMVSQIDGKLLAEINFSKLFQNLFPSGSVTGAPKIRSMKILHSIENRLRGLYTGSIITIHNEENRMVSNANVAIRTLQLYRNGSELLGTYAVGSGITMLSESETEYEECVSKLSFLTSKDIPDFEVLETIRFFSGRYRFLTYHLERMRGTCERLGFPFDISKAKEALESISQVATGLLRIRLLVNIKGDFRAESFDFIRTNKKRKINLCFSKTPIDAEDKFFYHKTTIRNFYTKELELASLDGSEDVILLDKFGNISETCLRNVFYKLDDNWFTPSLTHGGLPGTLREKLLEKKWIQIRDTNPIELQNAKLVLVGNSLRGLERVNIREL